MWGPTAGCPPPPPPPVLRSGALRRVGPHAVLGLALVLGAITVGSALAVTHHLRDEARDTSRLLGRVFAGLNDPRPDGATAALLDLAAQVRSLGIAIAVTTAEGRAAHLGADAERLERVAKRFERIGRPARREPVGLGAVAERVVTYFRPRLPTLANPVTLGLTAAGPGPMALGDPVLVE